MALTKSDIEQLAKGFGPVVKEFVNQQIAPLEARLAAVKGKGLSFEGVHQRGKQYRRGMAVVSQGSLWTATEVTAETPGKTGAWQLAAKRGADGKGA